jgi:hypothetical protein
MPITFRSRKAIIPGFLYWNLGKKSTSLTMKVGPVSRTWSSNGRRTTAVNLPGPLGYRKTVTKNGRIAEKAARRAQLQTDLDAARARRDARRAAHRQP